MRYLSRVQLLGALLLSVGAVSACSLVYDLSADQCEVNADCEALGPEFANRECRAGVCVPREGGSSGGGGGPSGGCSKSSECLDDPANLGPTACIEGACVPLTNGSTCPVVLPFDTSQREELLRQPGGEPLVFGAFAPIPPQLLSTISLNYELAFSEFNKKTGGLIGADGRRRPLLAVVCETSTDRASLETSMDFLIDQVKTPGVIPFLRADDVQFIFELKRDADPFILSTMETDSTLAAMPDGDLVWQLLPSGREIALPVRPLLTRIIDAKMYEEDVRVAVVVNEDIRTNVDIVSTLLAEDGTGIEFNGKTALENGDEAFQSFTIHEGDTQADTANIVEALLEFQPHVVIAATSTEFYNLVFTSLEMRWNSETGNAPRPFYILSPYHFGQGAVLDRLTQFRSRMVGLNSATAADQRLYNTYLSRFKSAYQDVMNPERYENFYDAPYYMIYSAAAVLSRTPKLTGGDLARGMRQLVDFNGPTFGVGVDAINGALTALANGPIRLDGTLGPPDFDARGGRSTPGTVWCAGPQDTTLYSDVLRYDPETGELENGFDQDGNQLEELPCAFQL